MSNYYNTSANTPATSSVYSIDEEKEFNPVVIKLNEMFHRKHCPEIYAELIKLTDGHKFSIDHMGLDENDDPTMSITSSWGVHGTFTETPVGYPVRVFRRDWSEVSHYIEIDGLKGIEVNEWVGDWYEVSIDCHGDEVSYYDMILTSEGEWCFPTNWEDYGDSYLRITDHEEIHMGEAMPKLAHNIGQTKSLAQFNYKELKNIFRGADARKSARDFKKIARRARRQDSKQIILEELAMM